MKAAFVCWCVIASALAASAQDSVAIFFDLQNRTADTLDFGYVLAGDSVVQQLFIENETGREAVVPQGTRPYMWITPSPPYRDNDPEEFPLEALFPFRIGSGETRGYPLRYTATLFQQHPEGRHQVALIVSVRESDDTSRVLGQRRIVLRATKSFRPLWTDTPVLSLDSVYVGSPLVRSLPLVVRNVSRAVVPARIVRSGDSRSMSALTLDVAASDVFASEEIKNYRVQFEPTVAGSFALDVSFVHPSPLRSGRDDTTTVQLRGVGVIQQLECRQVIARNASISGDTVKLRYRRVSIPDTVMLVFQNTGNIPIGTVDLRLIEQGTLSEFAVLRSFRTTAALQPQQLDTVILVVRSLRAGIASATLEVVTDLLQRPIFGAPAVAAQPRFVVMVESQPQRLVPLHTHLDFGSILALGNCQEQRCDTLQLVNRGSEPVTVTTIVTPPPFTTLQALPLTVEPGQTVSLPIAVAMIDTVGEISGYVRIETNDTAYSPLEIPVSVQLVAPVQPKLRLAASQYTPGSDAYVAVLCDSSVWRYSAIVFDVSFDLTMAELRGSVTSGTAASGGHVRIESIGNGRYRVSVVSDRGMMARDTLVILVLRTYLGELPSAPMSLTSVAAGTLTCPDAVAGDGYGALLSVLPFCGMSYKFPVVLPQLVISSAQVLPDGTLLLDCWSDVARRCTIEVYAQDGRAIAAYPVELAAGRQSVAIPFEELPGAYALQLRSRSSDEVARRVVIVR